MAFRASRTSSSLNGLMIAVMSFIDPPSAAERNVERMSRRPYEGSHRGAQSSVMPILAFHDKSLNAWPNLHLAREAANKRKDFKCVDCYNKHHLHFFCTLAAQSDSTCTAP